MAEQRGSRGSVGTSVGRPGERDGLARFLKQVGTGPALFLIEGPAGIGKSTLWTEGVRSGYSRGYAVLECSLSSYEQSFPFAGLRDLLETVNPAVLAAVPPPLTAALEAALLRSGSGTPPEASAHTVAAAVHHVLKRLAAEQPVILAVDDLQWLDPATLGVLTFALRRVGHARISALLAGQDLGVWAVRTGLARDFPPDSVESVTLGALDQSSIEAVVEAQLGHRFAPETAAEIHRWSEGSPWYAIELAKGVLADQIRFTAGEPPTVPEMLRVELEARRRALDPAVRSVLGLAAVLTRPTLATLFAAAENETKRGAVRQALETGWLRVEGEEVVLTAPLLAAVAYDEQEPSARRNLHARLARLVDDDSERARHLIASGCGPSEAAAGALDRAAQAAARRSDMPAAAAFADQAVQFTPARGGDARIRRMLAATDHHLAAGSFPFAEEYLHTVLGEVGPGRSRAVARYRLAQVRGHQMGFPASLDLLRGALAEAGGDVGLCVELQCNLAFVSLTSGDIPGAACIARAALELADRRGAAPASVRTALISVGLFEFLTGAGVRRDLLARAAETATAPGTTTVAPDDNGRFYLPHIPPTLLKWDDRLDEAREGYTVAYTETLEADPAWAPWVLYHLTELECWAGNWSLAADLASECAVKAQLSGQLGVTPFAHYAEALVAAHTGRSDAARESAERGLTAAAGAMHRTAAQLNRWVLGFLAWSEGDAETAVTHLSAVRQAVSRMGLGDPSVVRYLPDLAEARLAVGDLEAAQAISNELIERGLLLDRRWARAAGHRSRALCRSEAGDGDGALADIAEAHRHHDALGQPFERARTLLAEGSIRRRSGQKRLAADALDAAEVSFAELGAVLWAAHAASESGRISGRPRPPRALTPSEERVAALVAQGWSNKLVAAELFMSVKTVESKLSRVYRKLGIASRRDLVTALLATDESGRAGQP